MKTYIYILIDPIINEIRYVGKTNTPKQRYDNHIFNEHTKSHKKKIG